MKIEKRCSNIDDFMEMFIDNLSDDNLTMDYDSKHAEQTWVALTNSDIDFYCKHGYIDVKFQIEERTYQIKKRRGRPSKKGTKGHRITVRLNENQYKALNDYCRANKIIDKSDAIRAAIDVMIGIDK
ncbi:MAG: ribbon-helix-helix protein, CopG family [Bacillota bacterium]